MSPPVAPLTSRPPKDAKLLKVACRSSAKTSKAGLLSSNEVFVAQAWKQWFRLYAQISIPSHVLKSTCISREAAEQKHAADNQQTGQDLAIVVGKSPTHAVGGCASVAHTLL
jgi:hypothetical protein